MRHTNPGRNTPEMALTTSLREYATGRPPGFGAGASGSSRRRSRSLLIAQGAVKREFIQRRLTAQKLGELRKVLAVGAHGFRGRGYPARVARYCRMALASGTESGCIAPSNLAVLAAHASVSGRDGNGWKAGCCEPPRLGRFRRSMPARSGGRDSNPRHPAWKHEWPEIRRSHRSNRFETPPSRPHQPCRLAVARSANMRPIRTQL